MEEKEEEKIFPPRLNVHASLSAAPRRVIITIAFEAALPNLLQFYLSLPVPDSPFFLLKKMGRLE